MNGLATKEILLENKNLIRESHSTILRFQKAYFELWQIQQQINDTLTETRKLIVENKKDSPIRESFENICL